MENENRKKRDGKEKRNSKIERKVKGVVEDGKGKEEIIKQLEKGKGKEQHKRKGLKWREWVKKELGLREREGKRESRRRKREKKLKREKMNEERVRVKGNG